MTLLRPTSRIYFPALWTAIAACSVLGRIIDHEAEVIETNPSLNKEQANEWSQQFFGTSKLSGPSQVEFLNENSYFLADTPGHYSSSSTGGSGSRSDRRVSNFASGFSTYRDQINNNNRPGNSRTNTRHYDVSSIDLPYAGKRPTIKQENLEWMLQHIFMYPRSHVTNETAKEYVKQYISDSFQFTSGIRTTVQHFEPLQFLSIYEHGQVPSGANVIGIIRGREWSSPNDRPIVIGAHYDTVNFTPGTDDNGSGVSAMLETARAIAHSACKPKYTIIFVAFDLEEVGSQGSLVFIREFLAKLFPKEVGMSKFQGAFVLDTMMNFNDTEYSQTFPTDWSLVIPDVYDQVANEKYKGDFLSMIYRRDVDNRLAEKFHFHWGKSSQDPRYKLKPMPLMLTADLPELEILADHLNFLRSDHARFWYMNDSTVPHTLNAVLMTDTGPYRGNMRNCYHTVCDGPEVSMHSNPDNIKFLAKITQVLTDTIIDMSECVWDTKRDAAPSNTFISTSNVHVKNSSPRGIGGSPLRHVFKFIRWMQNTI